LDPKKIFRLKKYFGPRKYFDQKKLWGPKIGPKKFLTQAIFSTQKHIFDPGNTFGHKYVSLNILDLKNILTKKIFWTWKIFWPKNIFGSKKLLLAKFFDPTTCLWSKNIFDPNNSLDPKNTFFEPKNYFWRNKNIFDSNYILTHNKTSVCFFPKIIRKSQFLD